MKIARWWPFLSLLLLSLLCPPAAWSCSFARGHAPKLPDAAEWQDRADLVFDGRVLRRERGPDGEALFVLSVETPIKGTATSPVTIVDPRARPCDSAYGITHLSAASDPAAARWRIHALRSDAGWQLLTARRLSADTPE